MGENARASFAFHIFLSGTVCVGIKIIFATLSRNPNHQSGNILFLAVLPTSAQSLPRFAQLFSQNNY